MPIIIDTDLAGQIWRYVDGVPHEQLILCSETDAQAQGLRRYGDVYPGERWETPGLAIRPEHVPRLYLVPPVAATPPAAPTRGRIRLRDEWAQEPLEGAASTEA